MFDLGANLLSVKALIFLDKGYKIRSLMYTAQYYRVLYEINKESHSPIHGPGR